METIRSVPGSVLVASAKHSFGQLFLFGSAFVLWIESQDTVGAASAIELDARVLFGGLMIDVPPSRRWHDRLTERCHSSEIDVTPAEGTSPYL